MVQKMMEHPSTQIQFRLRHQGTWTYEDWLKFPDDGWKYEILDGELYMTPPPATGDQRASVKLVIKMGSYVEAQGIGEVYLIS